MTEISDTKPRASTILAAEPQLFAQDLDVSREYYTTKLGFAVAFSYGEPAFYMHIARDGARLNFRHVDGLVFDAGFRDREPDGLSATLLVDDAQALYVEFQRAGVHFHRPLTDEPRGARTFIVSDPDGNLICFAGRGR
jgi:catechol 2,3-dioxygenase-like lactoylglutathione lyase family enzyme